VARETAAGPIRELLDYDGAAEPLHCSPRMVRKLVETRQLAHVKVGRLVRIEPEAIDAYIARNRVEASA
jgi:excisionase family DNA binding protein